MNDQTQISVKTLFIDANPSFRNQWLQHKQDREELLESAFKIVNSWISGMKDPELGEVGKAFLDEVAETKCREEIDIFHNGLADYYSFSYVEGRKGFVNHIVYGPSAEADLAKLFSGKIHEATHAVQKRKTAALHASPFNPGTNIIICPRDWTTLQEFCERGAYTNQAWFDSLLAPEIPEVHNMTSLSPLSSGEFMAIRRAEADIESTLVTSATKALEKGYYLYGSEPPYLFKHHYHDYALTNYEAGMFQRKQNNESGFIFVRIEPEDLMAIGASFGPNCFDYAEAVAKITTPSRLLEKTEERLYTLNNKLGITNENSLPTLRSVLENFGMTKEGYIANTYAQSIAISELNSAVLEYQTV